MALIIPVLTWILLLSEKTILYPAGPARLLADVDTLTSIRPFRNYEHPESLDRAADYIRSEFKKCTDRVVDQPYLAQEKTYRNIIASFGPENGERIIVGAHYDVCGDQPGADDNASGVAGLLELARLLKLNAPTLTTRVDLVAYSLEEPPFFRSESMGSFIHAKSLADQNLEVKAMICLEMIGYFSEEENSQGFPTSPMKLFYPTTGNFIMVIGNVSNMFLVNRVQDRMREYSKIDVRTISAPTLIPGIDYSDHLNYWKFGFPAVMINDTAFNRNRQYHKPGDTPDRLDYSKMADVVNGVYGAVVNF